MFDCHLCLSDQLLSVPKVSSIFSLLLFLDIPFIIELDLLVCQNVEVLHCHGWWLLLWADLSDIEHHLLVSIKTLLANAIYLAHHLFDPLLGSCSLLLVIEGPLVDFLVDVHFQLVRWQQSMHLQ